VVLFTVAAITYTPLLTLPADSQAFMLAPRAIWQHVPYLLAAKPFVGRACHLATRALFQAAMLLVWHPGCVDGNCVPLCSLAFMLSCAISWQWAGQTRPVTDCLFA
jgi:hypothetical protein